MHVMNYVMSNQISTELKCADDIMKTTEKIWVYPMLS